MKGFRFSRIPEINLFFFSFFLNFFWEVVQTYFYTLKDYPFSEMLYGWLHCTCVPGMVQSERGASPRAR